MARQKSHSLQISRPYDKTFEHCLNSVLSFGGIISKNDQQSGIIEAETKITWKSFGEAITINLTPINDNATEIKILSSSLFKTTLFDYGKNANNIDKLTRLIGSQ